MSRSVLLSSVAIPCTLRINKGSPGGALHFSRCTQNYESCITARYIS